MTRGQILCSKARANSTFNLLSNSISKLKPKPKCKIPFLSQQPLYLPPTSTRIFCKCSLRAQYQDQTDQEPIIDLSKYKESFSKRMALAGLKPHHRIALGVSGGPDSMALCVLTANWKKEGLADNNNGGFIDGLLAIIVDHGLRHESKEEANVVSCRVSQMGIRSEIAHCDWSEGRPKQGHIQEAARDMRYQIFQDICFQHGIGVLLIAHHSDDQAELFVLRLSRNSGVLGLAGMAYASQIFPSVPQSYTGGLMNHGIILVRPLLDFTKEDMYKICRGGNQEWVEDPSNQNPSFVRNRIRMSLGRLSYCIFKCELQALISACRKTRSYVDQICRNLINQAVTIMDEGYAIIDMEVLNSSKTEDICLSKFTTLVLQFISQRHRPIRGSTVKLVLDYMHTYPCKTSLTAGGCYLCPAPGSKGTKALVCCSVNCRLPSKKKLFYTCYDEGWKHCSINELEQIIIDGKSSSDHLAANVSDLHFLNIASESVLSEAKRLNIVSEPTYKNILSLQREENKHFKPKFEIASDHESKDEVELASTSLSEPLQRGKLCYFMNRFFVMWKPNEEIASNAFPGVDCRNQDLGGEVWQHHCSSCIVDPEMVIKVRHMIESDWLYLTKLSKCSTMENFEDQGALFSDNTKQLTDKTNASADHARLSAQRALALLKCIPVAARRSLPVLVNHQGTLLSIPSINFNCCPCLTVTAAFKPRVPLGGGHSSFL